MKYTGRKGWQASSKDTWSIGRTMNPIIHSVLVKFLEINQNSSSLVGVPNSIILDMYGQHEDVTEQMMDDAFDVWVSHIKDMVFSFDPLHNDVLVSSEVAERIETGRKLFIKHYDDLWW